MKIVFLQLDGDQITARQLDQRSALHLARSLERERHASRADGLALPQGLDELARAALRLARGDSDRQEPTPVDGYQLIAESSAAWSPLVLTSAEAAQRLKLSKRQVERHIASGSLRSFLIGGSRRVRLEDLQKFIGQ